MQDACTDNNNSWVLSSCRMLFTPWAEALETCFGWFFAIGRVLGLVTGLHIQLNGIFRKEKVDGFLMQELIDF